ncbi:MAG: hypothetical protein ACRETW_04660 [Stenotrophobium sp.]
MTVDKLIRRNKIINEYLEMIVAGVHDTNAAGLIRPEFHELLHVQERMLNAVENCLVFSRRSPMRSPPRATLCLRPDKPFPRAA